MAKTNNPLPANEQERLKVLKGYNVLDTMPEKEYDDITKLASAICGTPVTFISLIDEKRLWFKSKIGINAPEIPRSISLCQHTIMQQDVLEVEDATKDPEFAQSPLVTGPAGFRFYAGTPLTTPEGHNIGTLCVIDIKPHKLTGQQKEALSILARQVMTHMELRKRQYEAEQETRLISESHALLNAFFENSPSSVTIRDLNSVYLYVNSQVEHSWGMKPSDVIGRSIYDLATKDLADEISADDRQVIETKKGVRKEYKMGEGESARYYVSNLFPLLNEKKEVYGIGTITNEVTATKKIELELKQSNDRFLNIFHNSPVGMTIVSTTGQTITHANKSFLRMFGFKNDQQVIGKSAEELGLTTEEATRKGKAQMTKQGFIQNVEIQISLPTGQELTVLSSVNIIGLADAKVLLTSYFDITESRKLQREVEASNDRFTSLFYNSPTGIAIADIATGKLIMVNNSFLSIFRYEHAAEVIGKSAAQLGMIMDLATREANMEEVRKYGRVKEKEILAYRKTGEPIYCLTSIEFIEMGGKKVAVSAFQDITEYKILEKEIKESNVRFTSLFYNSPIGLSISDVKSRRLLQVNNTFLTMFGFTEEEVIGKTAEELHVVTDQKEREEHISKFIENRQAKNREVGLYKKNGELMYCLSSIEMIEMEGKMLAITALQDITERKKIETQLKEAKKEAEQATLSKSSFLANMSHEIRTPLNAMLGFADLLGSTRLDEQQKDYLDAIDTSGKNLLTIINDILDFSKIEAGMLNIEQVPFSPGQLLQSVYTMFFTRAQSKNLKLFISIDPKLPALLSGDPTRLNQIMINLIGNAIKFTSEGSISVDCEVVSRSARQVKLKISVKDTGIGISANKMATIFDRFTQAENDTARNYGGTGLGLSIAKKLIELHGGEIHVKSEPGKGSEFYFIIGYAIADEKEEYVTKQEEQKKIRGEFKGRRVLIVEDNQLNQKLAMTLLQNEGFDVEIAENGQVAVDLLRDRKYDIILMDLQMPLLDGYQATRKIRRELGNTTPIIAMTANAMAGEQERCIDMGMDDYITKPFKSESLLAILSGFLNNNKTATAKENRPQRNDASKVTDLAYLRDFSGGKDDFVKEMLEVFLEQNPKDLDTLENALANDNFAAMKAVAHSLQTSLGFIGFSDQLIKRLKEAEVLAAQQKDIDIVKANLRLIIDNCRQAHEELKKDLEQLRR